MRISKLLMPNEKTNDPSIILMVEKRAITIKKLLSSGRSIESISSELGLDLPIAKNYKQMIEGNRRRNAR